MSAESAPKFAEEGVAGEFKDCCICKNSIGINNVAKTACEHEFHVDCLVKWLIKNNTCPMCRAEIKHEDKDVELSEDEKVLLENTSKIVKDFINFETGLTSYRKYYAADRAHRFNNVDKNTLATFQWLLNNLDCVMDWKHFSLTLRLFEKQYPDYFKYPPIEEVLVKHISVQNIQELKYWEGFQKQLENPGVQEKCDAALADRPILKQKFNQIDCIIM